MAVGRVPSGRGPRRLTDGEIAIWLQVTQTVVPLTERALPDPAPPAPEPVALPPPNPPAMARVFDVPSYSPPPPATAAPGLAPLERRFKRRVAGGRIGIDRALDLHGMTQARAHEALRHFLLDAQRDDARLVLVVTGKGRVGRTSGDGEGLGVLRRAVPLWLRDSTLRGLVAGFEEAAPPHGGAGALYIRLRRAARPH